MLGQNLRRALNHRTQIHHDKFFVCSSKVYAEIARGMFYPSQLVGWGTLPPRWLVVNGLDIDSLGLVSNE